MWLCKTKSSYNSLFSFIYILELFMEAGEYVIIILKQSMYFLTLYKLVYVVGWVSNTSQLMWFSNTDLYSRCFLSLFTFGVGLCTILKAYQITKRSNYILFSSFHLGLTIIIIVLLLWQYSWDFFPNKHVNTYWNILTIYLKAVEIVHELLCCATRNPLCCIWSCPSCLKVF